MIIIYFFLLFYLFVFSFEAHGTTRVLPTPGLVQSQTPYRKVVDGKVTHEIEYLSADEEEEYVVAQANAKVDEQGHFTDARVLVRRSPQSATLKDLKLQLERDVFFGATTEISAVVPEEVQLMDISPKQMKEVTE